MFTTATPSTPYIGQNYAGGIIFYIDSTGLHGLVCASADQGNWVTWGCYGTSIPTGSAIGTGATNTASIVASCGEANIAAKICNDLVLNSYSDWFLPSKDELALMYTNLMVQDLGGFSYYYWSSTEWVDTRGGNVNIAWTVNFVYGADFYEKRNEFSVRAVRAF